jgi:uncharacterized metal-binding protein YceD (DUF177 family)
MFKIYVDRLKNGQTEKIDVTVNADFLDVADISFSLPVTIQGEAYLADEHLILHMQAHTETQIPCVICNKSFTLKLAVSDFYHSVPLLEIKAAIFDFSSLLREDILLQIPQFAECSGGTCPERVDISKFLKTKKTDAQFPFSGL